LDERAREIGRTVMRDLENIRTEVECTPVVLAREEAACLIVQVAREEVAETPVGETENNGMTVDGV
jgi:hypothetical protein